jgi:hypothetical protein
MFHMQVNILSSPTSQHRDLLISHSIRHIDLHTRRPADKDTELASRSRRHHFGVDNALQIRPAVVVLHGYGPASLRGRV